MELNLLRVLLIPAAMVKCPTATFLLDIRVGWEDMLLPCRVEDSSRDSKAEEEERLTCRGWEAIRAMALGQE